MDANKPNTKICKYCKTEIPKDAKVCPQCRKKQGGILKWVIIGIVVLIVLAGALGGGGNKTASTTTGSASANTAAPTEVPIEYTVASVDDMMSALSANALNASTTYKGQYLEITGRLGVIDSSGAYISLYPENDQYAIVGVMCRIKNDEQKTAVAAMSVGDTVTLRGKCTDAGEVIGYTLDIDSIG